MFIVSLLMLVLVLVLPMKRLLSIMSLVVLVVLGADKKHKSEDKKHKGGKKDKTDEKHIKDELDKSKYAGETPGSTSVAAGAPTTPVTP